MKASRILLLAVLLIFAVTSMAVAGKPTKPVPVDDVNVVQAGEKMPGFVQKLITTRNLGGSRLEDIYFGGMNNHIEHHLFPSIPSARLRKARLIVKTFCLQHGLSYREMNWRKAAGEVFIYLNRIGRSAV